MTMSARPRNDTGSAENRSPSYAVPPYGARFRPAHATATGSMSTACTSTPGTNAATAAPTAPDPQHMSTTTEPGRASSAARRASTSVRRAGATREPLGAPARHEDARRNGDAQPAELSPPDDVLHRYAGSSPVQQRRQ